MIRAIVFDCYGVLVDDKMSANEPLLNYIRTDLKPRYKLGILSNIDAHSIEGLLTPEQRALFDVAALSFQTGLVKPDSRAYRFVADQLDVQSSECLFIDDIERFCTAAQHEGMLALCYHSFEQMKEAVEAILAST